MKFSFGDSTLHKARNPIIEAICTSEPVSCILIKGDYTTVALKEASFQAQTISWELPASLQHKQWAGLKSQSGNTRFVVNSRKPDRGERVKVHCCFEKKRGRGWSWFQWQWIWWERVVYIHQFNLKISTNTWSHRQPSNSNNKCNDNWVRFC